MKKFLLAMTLIAACGGAYADELADGVKSFEQGNFQQAVQIYTKLANAGNADAQEKLAEMYWYGEAGGVDLAKAEFWFKKSQEQGNAKAKAALVVMAARVARKNDIDYYTTRFDGGDLQFSKLGCVRPTIPALSKDNAEIARVTKETKAWTDCYNGFVAKLNAVLPAGKSIPQDLSELMSDDDLTHAKALMDKTYSAIASDAEKNALAVDAQFAAWKDGTEKYVKETNLAREADKNKKQVELAEINIINRNSKAPVIPLKTPTGIK